MGSSSFWTSSFVCVCLFIYSRRSLFFYFFHFFYFLKIFSKCLCRRHDFQLALHFPRPDCCLPFSCHRNAKKQTSEISGRAKLFFFSVSFRFVIIITITIDSFFSRFVERLKMASQLLFFSPFNFELKAESF